MTPSAEAKASTSRLTIAVCAPQVPFVSGGAEEHVSGLCQALRQHGHRVELITMPYKWYPQRQLHNSMNMWQQADLSEANGQCIDLVISTKFPSYFVNHPCHILWLTHQYRQLYDLYGSAYSEYSPNRLSDRLYRRRFIRRDSAALSRIPRRYTISNITRDRLLQYNQLSSESLYHPSRLSPRLHCRQYGDYILSVGRLDPLKRIDYLLEALARTRFGLKAVIAGTGPQELDLKELAVKLGLTDQVDFVGYVNDDQLIELYAGCRAVWFSPLDEDYGYITLEAFGASKPVLTCLDSGGPLEFVKSEQNGYILPPGDHAAAAQCIDMLAEKPDTAQRLGQAGHLEIQGITWERVITRLLEDSR